uniref:Uncharacterized protein n=1 Tax=Aegilops tauschii subsp. strangulata TaxID=200361 RepID=A0A453H8Z6_AEGTS
PCLIGSQNFHALCGLGSTMIPFTVYEPLPLGDVRPTSITLHLANQDLADILGDIPALVGNFAFPVDFVVLEM